MHGTLRWGLMQMHRTLSCHAICDSLSCQGLGGIESENNGVWLCMVLQRMHVAGLCVCVLVQVNSVLTWTWVPCWRGVK